MDGNVYHTVKIGTQVWMVENLKVTKYRNGAVIPPVDDATWPTIETGSYCNYDNLNAHGDTYGRLYTWYAITDSRKIAPTGWHVPTDAEWKILTDYLDPSNNADKLKAKTHWPISNTATNASGFTALPGGWYLGSYYDIGNQTYFWSSTPNTDPSKAMSIVIADAPSTSTIARDKKHGFSIRCIKGEN